MEALEEQEVWQEVPVEWKKHEYVEEDGKRHIKPQRWRVNDMQ
jgi:hypothetical protein